MSAQHRLLHPSCFRSSPTRPRDCLRADHHGGNARGQPQAPQCERRRCTKSPWRRHGRTPGPRLSPLGQRGRSAGHPFYRLDDFIAQNRIARVDCIKIDVDSFDFEVLRGAERTLREHNPAVIVELNDALAKRNQHAGEALAWLAARGYRQARVLDHDNFVLQRGADAFSGLKDATRLELLFAPPLRIDQEMPASAGSAVGGSVVKAEQLHNSATTQPIRDGIDEGGGFRPGAAIEAAWDRLVRRQDKGPAIAVDDLTHCHHRDAARPLEPCAHPAAGCAGAASRLTLEPASRSSRAGLVLRLAQRLLSSCPRRGAGGDGANASSPR